MAVEKQKRGGRFARLVFARLLPLVLIIAIAIVLVGLAQNLLRYLGEQSEATSRRPAYAATATAIAEITPEGDLKLGAYKLFEPPAQDITFATNTPQAVVPPSPEITSTPRPLPTLWIYQQPEAVEAGGTAIPTPVEAVDRQGMDLLNIVLLGHDGELTNDGFIRTDTMIIVSINRTAGTVSMLSLPRDLFVYIPGWTMQRLNLAYIHGESIGWTGGGFGLLRQTIFYNFGINVHYYAMVSLDGFRAIVDAVGGINLAVDCAIQDLPLIGAEVPRDAVRVTEDGEYALPVGYYAMNGAEALWYARSRGNSSDFDRGRRQQQVLRGVWRQARDNGLLSSLPSLWAESQQYIQTNLTLDDLIPLIPLAANLNPNQIESYTFNRLYHTTPWTPPDGSNVQLPNPDQVRELMIEFYSPATESQTANEAATVFVYNGTNIPNLDLVAAERLNWEGIAAVPMGSAETTDYINTVLIDYTGRSKASSLGDIVGTLNIVGENIRVEPSPTRESDFVVILGETYNSCTEGGVLPVEMPPAGG